MPWQTSPPPREVSNADNVLDQQCKYTTQRLAESTNALLARRRNGLWNFTSSGNLFFRGSFLTASIARKLKLRLSRVSGFLSSSSSVLNLNAATSAETDPPLSLQSCHT
mmetsp:Transcript_36237/g.86340  ORF Transcript_36237/g.86340 Transcript_36237/m.86340 type:complete len:109 (+) Transcript_36237:2767-3093(+)